jgi:polysaccharide pyruvyl transferase WcaK-like protein
VRVLLGGVPFGCNNIGDEAILEGAVKIFRQECPGVELVVCTDDPEKTRAKLLVETRPLYGFVEKAPTSELVAVIGGFDVFVWCGATGLSDYPEVGLSMLRIALDKGLTTILWGVGMNTELNPAFYSLGHGRRRAALGFIRACTFGLWNAVAWAETRRARRTRRRLGHALSRADLIVVRDPGSREEVLKCGVSRAVHVGADSALILEPSPPEALTLGDEVRTLLARGGSRLGVCISAQRELVGKADLLRYLDDAVETLGASIFFLPMNPITDATLMRALAQQMRHRERTSLVEGLVEPADVLSFLPHMDVVVSSRLHLLILAAIVHVPIIGISRGSKVDNFLAPYGLKSVGSVEDCAFSSLYSETARMLAGREEFVGRSKRVLAELLERLETARTLLRSSISGTNAHRAA